MVRINVGKCFEPYQAHELIDFLFFLMQKPTGNESRLDIATNRQPRKQVRILKNQTTFRVRRGDPN